MSKLKKLPVVSIAGRPNVGKSSLFNRLIGYRKAIVDNTTGITRDRLIAECHVDDNHFLLVDTGGIISEHNAEYRTQSIEHRAQSTDELSIIDCRLSIENSNNQQLTTNNHLQNTEHRAQNTDSVGSQQLASGNPQLPNYQITKLSNHPQSSKPSTIDTAVARQIKLALTDADVFLFVVDAQAGILPDDNLIADILRKFNKPIILVVNKLDGEKQEIKGYEFAALGFDSPVFVSVLHNRNIDILKEKIYDSITKDSRVQGFKDSRIQNVKPIGSQQLAGRDAQIGRLYNRKLPNYQITKLSNHPQPSDLEPQPIRLAIIGAQNVGKSTLVNSFLKTERVIVSEIPGTTRDAIDAEFYRCGNTFKIIDTAGLKKKKDFSDSIYYYSSQRTMDAIDSADVVAVMIEPSENFFEREKKIINMVIEKGKGILLAVNKIDLLPKKINIKNFKRFITAQAPFVNFIPIVAISAVKKIGMDSFLETVLDIFTRLNFLIPQTDLEDAVKSISALFPPAGKGKKFGRIFSVTQKNTSPVIIQFKVNDKTLFPKNYEKLLENNLRGIFNLEGIPIKLIFENR